YTMKFSIIIPLVAAICVCTGKPNGRQERAADWTVGQTVNTSSGLVGGHAAKNRSQVSEYLGIPFAQPPIGDLRFAAPVKYAGNSSHNGSSYGPSCPSKSAFNSIVSAGAAQAANLTSLGKQFLGNLGGSTLTYSEDCLYVNVWTKPQTGEAKKAVMLWIYGGAFNSGSSSSPLYVGANIAELEDVVVVSFNYRLSILGFPGNPLGPSNPALLDQRLAVEWVRDNIETFGGDSSRITLFGESAGGASLDYYSYAWAKDPIVSGLISESGTVFSWGLPVSKNTSAMAWFNVTATLGCGDALSDSSSVLSCMRSKNYTAILDAIPADLGASVLGAFVPTIDEEVVLSNYSERTPADVPLLVGSNDYEAGLFRATSALAGSTYPDSYWDEQTLQGFTCPAGNRANASISARNPTWRYRYFGDFPNLALSPQSGAYHASELALIFDVMPPASTPEELLIATYMRGAWAAFAKDPVNGLTNYGWPSYDSSADTLIRLAYNNITGPNVANPYLYDANCTYANLSRTNGTVNGTTPTAGAAPKTSSSASATTGLSTTGTPVATATHSGATKISGSLVMVLAATAVAYFL
ncbi:Cholinesterase, partial [Lachnellula suecica]